MSVPARSHAGIPQLSHQPPGAFVAFWRRDRNVVTLLAAIFIVFFAAYASLGNWMGGRSYGPRYLIPLLPALVVLLAFSFGRLAAWRV